jgi:hypothetical protein
VDLDKMGSYPFPIFNHDISLSFDILGSPVLVAYPGGVYFALSGKGTLPNWQQPISSYSTFYSIFVGAIDTNGNLVWINRFPASLQTEGDCYSPSIALGNPGELYLAFVTDGAIPGYANGSTFPPSPGSNPPYGTADVVLSRINTVDQTVVWAIQGAALNGPSNQTVPQVAVDTTYDWVYIVYQSTGNITSYQATGKTNIILSCYNTITNEQLWINGHQSSSGQEDYINCTDYNKNPTVITDNAGNVYIAYEVTGQTPYGAAVSEQQIEVVKFKTTNMNTPLNPVYVKEYQWTLSSSGTNIFVTKGKSSQPQLSYWNNVLYLSFLTSGVIPGGTHSPSGNDIVLFAIRTNRVLKWAIQGLTNVCPQKYYDVYSVNSCCDEFGIPYVVAVVKKFGSRDSVLVWKLNPENGVSTLKYTTPNGLSNYSAYGFGLTDGKNAVWQSKSYQFTTIGISAIQGKFYLGYTTLDALPNSVQTITPKHFVGISGFMPRIYAENTSVYNYITSEHGICRCNDSQCGCFI